MPKPRPKPKPDSNSDLAATALTRQRHVIKRRNKNGTTRYYWQPSASLAAGGWESERLPVELHLALQRAQHLNRLVDQQRKEAEAELTLTAAIARYKDSRGFKALRESSQRTYFGALKQLDEACGGWRLQSISRKRVMHWYAYEQAQRSEARAQTLLAVLSLTLSHALYDGLITVNPVAGIRRGAAGRRETLWTQKQVDLVVAVARGQTFVDNLHKYLGVADAVLLGAATGQRIGDLLKLTWGPDFDGRRVKLRQDKTGATIDVALESRVAAHFVANRQPDGQPVIAHRAAFKPRSYEPSTFNEHFRRVRDEAALQDASIGALQFRDLRATLVCRLARSGCTPFQVASFTGHALSSVEQTLARHYWLRDAEQADAALAKLEETTIPW